DAARCCRQAAVRLRAGSPHEYGCGGAGGGSPCGPAGPLDRRGRSRARGSARRAARRAGGVRVRRCAGGPPVAHRLLWSAPGHA
ncbi:malto-oligosyltrehalose trehalohydrolase, partial [Stenotrophomonas maltophilia]